MDLYKYLILYDIHKLIRLVLYLLFVIYFLKGKPFVSIGKIDDIDEETDNIQTDLDELRDQLETEQADRQSGDIANREYADQISGVTETLTEATESLEEQIAQITAVTEDLNARVSANTTSISNLSSDLDTLENVVLEHTTAIEEMQESIAALNDEIDTKADKNDYEIFKDSISARVLEIETDYLTSDDIQDLAKQSSVDDLATELGNLSQRVVNLEDTTDTIQDNIAVLNDNLNTLDHKYEEIYSLFDELREQHESLEIKVINLIASVRAIKDLLGLNTQEP